MISFAINHVTVANATFSDLLELSASLGCIGIEARNDLTGALFDGQDPATVRHMLRQSDLRLLALAELKAFNNFSAKTLDEASALISIAKDCGAEGISLIPRNDGVATDPKARAASLKLALTEIKPLLEEAGITGFVEPLGFASSSLRYKHELVAEIEALDASNLYKIVHDTFHHHLAGDTGFYPEHTGIVHVSGVTEQSLGPEQMHDKHRIFVNEQDRLNNIGQLATLRSSGYEGPVSFEVFAPQAQQLERAYSAVNDSIEFITSAITANAA